MSQLIPFNAERHAILFVTASSEELGTLPYLLDRHDLRSAHADSLAAGIARAAAGGIDLILLNAALAGASLNDACRRLMTAASGTPVPLFLISAQASPGEQGLSIGAGAADYLKLPFDGQVVAEKILMELALRKAVPQMLRAGAVHPQTLEVSYHAILAGSTDAVVLYDADNRVLIDANHHAELLFGRPGPELLQAGLVELCPPRQPDGTASRLAIDTLLNQVLAGASRVFDLTFLQHGAGAGHNIACDLRLVLLPVPGRRLMHVRIVDISARKRAEALRNGQNDMLEMIANGAPLERTLARLMELIESQSDGVYCSVMLLDAGGRHVVYTAGPHLPQAYLDAFLGLEIGPTVGSCGTAMHRGATVIVSDIEHDPLWAPYRALAAPHGLRACWSTPIRNRDNVLGSFAMYYRDVRSPSPDEIYLIGVASHLAGIAIERSRREQELERYREHLEELVAERTADLTLAKEQSELTNAKLAAALQHLNLTQEQLLRRDKLAALGTLVAGVAHELNTPIGNSLVVAGSMAERTRLMQTGMGDGLRRSELASYLDQAAEADHILQRNLERAAHLVSSFKQIAVDHSSSKRRHFSLHRLVAEWMLPMQATLRHTAYALEQQIPAELVMDSYPGPLGQVLTSLVDNCVLHGFEGRDGGAIRIAACNDGAQIALSVSDDGVGIAPANLEHIYDPFFTTRLGAGGTGLGLHIAHNIVTGVLGGRIEVASDTHSGTTFTLLLPKTAPKAEPAAADADSKTKAGSAAAGIAATA